MIVLVFLLVLLVYDFLLLRLMKDWGPAEVAVLLSVGVFQTELWWACGFLYRYKVNCVTPTADLR